MTAPAPLPRRFFVRPPVPVARDLLGHLLVRELPEGRVLARIVEVEAYLGEDDPAAHAYAGPTRRNAVLFGPPGHAYIYLSYGIHDCLNVSTLPAGRAGGVLFRALELWPGQPAGIEAALQRRAPTSRPARLLSGPGRLARALGITRALNGHDLTRRGPLYLARAPGRGHPAIAASPRVGITKARELPLRFFLPESPAVSGPRRAPRPQKNLGTAPPDIAH
ncbi:MAG TPA: DNA-3-methyladenine glycosylase [Terriglobales bacterium]|nr:DNA-3-methyladenine glycosylase [Terriglobales bacterium]